MHDIFAEETRTWALAGSPFESSDSDSSSDGDDDTMSLGSSDLFSNDVSLVSEESNRPWSSFHGRHSCNRSGCHVSPAGGRLAGPSNHQGGRSCDRPNQKYHAQQEFPQDIGLWAAVSDTSGPKVFQGLCESPFEKAHSFGDGEQEYDEDLLYSGPALGGWLTGTLDGVPKTMLGNSFAMED
ncbi:hypothetical protein BGY98DRAFT_1002486 [Russula aff. rugulosa BPL654]|nr:hypothetical protein BGY98DRAFT_1002486 [Russula aff. rugulosa BPL654]